MKGWPMKKSDLDAILKRARLPEIPEESLEMFPRRVVAQIKHGERPAQERRSFPFRIAWALALASCLLALVGWLALRPRETKEAAGDALADARVIRETLAMFPNQVSAIVEDERGLHLVLSDRNDVPASAPLYVRICDGKQCTSVVTFSGQEVVAAGQTLTVLSDARGGVILEGKDFAWSSEAPGVGEQHLKITAKTLGGTAM
jgi:hypothetical protein